jgi:hypothetical protein
MRLPLPAHWFFRKTMTGWEPPPAVPFAVVALAGNAPTVSAAKRPAPADSSATALPFPFPRIPYAPVADVAVQPQTTGSSVTIAGKRAGLSWVSSQLRPAFESVSPDRKRLRLARGYAPASNDGREEATVRSE